MVKTMVSCINKESLNQSNEPWKHMENIGKQRENPAGIYIYYMLLVIWWNNIFQRGMFFSVTRWKMAHQIWKSEKKHCRKLSRSTPVQKLKNRPKRNHGLVWFSREWNHINGSPSIGVFFFVNGWWESKQNTYSYTSPNKLCSIFGRPQRIFAIRLLWSWYNYINHYESYCENILPHI